MESRTVYICIYIYMYTHPVLSLVRFGRLVFPFSMISYVNEVRFAGLALGPLVGALQLSVVDRLGD